MTRTYRELVAALDADAFDVHQPDVVLAAGMSAAGSSPSWRSGRAAGTRRTPGRTGSGCWRTSTSPPASAAGRSSSSPTTRPAGPPNVATPCSPSRSGRAGRNAPRAAATGARRGARRGRPPPVRGMTDPSRLASTTGFARRNARATGRDVHRRPVCAGGLRPDVQRHRPARWPPDHGRRGRRRRGRRPGRRRGTRLVRRSPLGGPVAEEPQARPAAIRRADPGRPRASRADRVAGRRQADPRHAHRRRPMLRDDIPVVRGGDRQGLRRDRPDRARGALPRHPRAGWGRGRDRPLELPAHHHRLEGRAGPRRR